MLMEQPPKPKKSTKRIDVQCLNCTKEEKVILDNVSFDVRNDEALVILGPGRSGKTTILNILANVSIEHLQFSADRLSSLNNFAYLEQQEVFLEETFEEIFVSFGLDISTEIDKHWDDTELVGKLLHYAKISRVKIPVNFYKLLRITLFLSRSENAKVLLLDEPDANLHEDLDLLIRKIKQLKVDRTLVIVSHNIEFTENVADQILYLSYGNVIEYSTTKEFFNSENEHVKYILKLGC